MLHFFVQYFHDFGDIFDNCWIVAILIKGLKIFLSGRCIKVSRTTNSDDYFELIHKLLITASIGEGDKDGFNMEMNIGIPPVHLTTEERSEL